MRKLSFATLLGKKNKDKLGEDQLNSIRSQACLPNEVSPRLRATIPSTNRDSSQSGLLVFGTQDLFFFLTQDFQNSVPNEADIMCVIPTGSISRWYIDERRVFVVVTENGTSFQFAGDEKDSSWWTKEALSMMDFQMLRYQRDVSESKSFLFAFLENKDDFSSIVESEPSLKELSNEETLLFDVRLLQRPDSMSAESMFFAGQRFVARWMLGTRKTAVILIVDPNQGIVLLIPLLGVWTCFFFDQIPSWGSKRGSLSIKHIASPNEAVVVHTFSCAFADELDALIKLELDGHARRDPKQQPCLPMPLLYPPSMPASVNLRVGGGAASKDNQEKSKTIMEKRKKTVRNQLKTIRQKKAVMDKSGADIATAFLGINDEQ